MSTLGERLREERERLGMSQSAFGEIGGVQKRAQINYEAGERNPDAQYLAAIAAAGVDVLYVLTGVGSRVQRVLSHVQKAAEIAKSATDLDGKAALQEQVFQQLNNELNPREQALLDNYRNTPPDRQRFIEDAAVMASQRRTAKGGRK